MKFSAPIQVALRVSSLTRGALHPFFMRFP